ncbi:MAG: hypothetical protein CEE43_12700 [Promethearchaeota archaeon Loki_b32]|nr:MAG: hypothetical protein CEE43_12700 [Candidatus Lokiarchaeota archaeon Loki_b32]
MKRVLKKNNKRNLLKPIIFITLFLAIISFQIFNYLGNLNENQNNYFNNEDLLIAQDTTAPIIIFLQPLVNNTIIKPTTYTIKANISDDNPPLYGNVTLQMSNHTAFLFNVTMEYDGENLWSFKWDNISSYSNLDVYIIQVWAKDSSPDENQGKSNEFYIYLSIITDAPGILTILLYVFAVSIIFAGVIVCLNKKLMPKSLRKKRGKELKVF